ncbi:MAG: pyruvate, phosphate dikinase [Reyranella sp.]|nr:pyruvate, phosphate dikinase [Reyranella sp.]
MTFSHCKWTLALDGSSLPDRALIGGKAWSLARMRGLGLQVPPAFVVTSRACIHFLQHGDFPPELKGELATGIGWLEAQAGRTFGRGPSALLVSVRSGAAISMPGMMDTVLNLGITDATEQALAQECGDAAFARDTHRRFLELYAGIVLKATLPELAHGAEPAAWRATVAGAAGAEVPGDALGQLHGAVRAVFDSWNSRRAKRYRQHHGIPDDLGTAVTVQAMVFGNMDERSGTGVLFTRNPLTGEREPYGEYLPRAQGEDVVSGKFTPRPLGAMDESVPHALVQLLDAARTLEEANGDIQDIEFTVERGKLYLLQARSAKRAPQAAVRAAVDMVREGRIDVDTALARVTPEQIRVLLSPRLAGDVADGATVLAHGEGACPGIGVGLVVTDADEAERHAAAGEAVVLVRPTTSPNDVHGMIAAKAVVTEQGGSTSHAAVVSRALGLPCVVGCGAVKLAQFAGRVVTVDGQTGNVYDGALRVFLPDEHGDERLSELARWAAERAPLKVLAPAHAPAEGVADLDRLPGAEDPERIGAVLAGLAGARGARGGAIASEAGVRAAIAAKLEFIVAEPVLPALLAAAQAARAA